MTVWHYAVWRGSNSMQPACDALTHVSFKSEIHGITINRGDVDCPECLAAMGSPTDAWKQARKLRGGSA